MTVRKAWSRQQLLVAFSLYCQIPFGKMHSRNPEIIKFAKIIQRTPSALAMKLSNIASLDPVITQSGRKGLEGASATDKAMWDEMQQDWQRFALDAQSATASFGSEVEVSSDQLDSSLDVPADYTGKNKASLVTVRVGQQFFRRSVLSAYDNRCCITGLAIPVFLVASHIVPWRIDEKNRLNPRNGLCLSSIHDKAFDIGMITITKEMTVKVSKCYMGSKDSFYEMALMAYDGKPIAVPEKFQPSEEFLSYHRENIYLDRG